VNPLEKYVSYIKSTGRSPLPVEMFDEDWEPIGPQVRRQLLTAGLVAQCAGGLVLVNKL